MGGIEGNGAVRQVLSVLREAMEGPSGPYTFFIDNRPGAGFLGALAELDAERASREVGGSTIAAHVHHIAFGMDVAAAAVQGDNEPRDWKAGWSVSTVDAAEWAQLSARVEREYQALRRAIESSAGSGEPAFAEAVGVVAHVAYHLGAVRQKMASLRAG